MIDQGMCTAFTVTATRGSLERIDVSIIIYRGPLPQIELRFQNLWLELGP
jgi:hypothetical protein